MQAVKNEVASSYAKALVDLSEEKGKLEAVHTDMETMMSLIGGNKKLFDLLSNPVVDIEQKRSVLTKLGKDAGFNQYTNNFLNLLTIKDRLGMLDQICESFEEQYCSLTDTQVSSCVWFWEAGLDSWATYSFLIPGLDNN